MYLPDFSSEAKKAAERDPEQFAQRQSIMDNLWSARMREDPREKEYLARQREVRELMERYGVKDDKDKKKKTDSTVDQIINDKPE